MTKFEKILWMIVAILAIMAIMAAILVIVKWNAPTTGATYTHTTRRADYADTFTTFYPATDPEPDPEMTPDAWQAWHDRNF